VDTPTGKQHTVGVHLTPTFDLVDGRFVIGDTVTVGPKLIPVEHLNDYQTPVPPPDVFLESMGFFPALDSRDLEPHQSGIQARLNGHPDFYIEWNRKAGKVLHLVGLDSPGLTSAPAIAKHVRAMIAQRNP
jgi:glycerol-3-phosphate dehydrogenase